MSRLSRERINGAGLVSLDRVRMWLAGIWLTGGGAIVLLLAVQSLLNAYGELTQDAWGWFLPTLMPTLGMIVTVLTYTALDPLALDAVVRRPFFRIAASLSLFYLLLVLLTIAIQPLTATTAADRVALMRTSNLWLGPVQGIVASALGVLFVSKQRR